MSEPMTDARLDEIEARAKAATSGPWKVSDRNGDGRFSVEKDPGGYGRAITGWGSVTQTQAEAKFIAAARTDVPDLVDEVRRLKDALRFAADRLADIAAGAADAPLIASRAARDAETATRRAIR